LETLTLPHRLSFSADGRVLALADGNAIGLWDFASRQELTTNLMGHRRPPSRITVTDKGILASSGDDTTVRIWDTVTTKQQRDFEVGDWVRAICLSPSGNLLAASSLDDHVHVWDTASGREIYRLAGHGRYGGHRTLGFLPDGQSLLSWGDDFYLRKWAMKNGKALLEHDLRPPGLASEDEGSKGGKFFDAEGVITPDGKTLVLEVGGQFRLIDTLTGKERSQFASEGRFASSMAISLDSSFMLLSSWGDYRVGTHPVSLIDLKSGKTRLRLTLAGSVAGPVAFSPDGRTFATSVEGDEKEILVYEIASGKVRQRIGGMPGRVWSLAFFPDGRRLASGSSDTTVLIWDLQAHE
jgi:WD40 repeat protein